MYRTQWSWCISSNSAYYDDSMIPLFKYIWNPERKRKGSQCKSGYINHRIHDLQSFILQSYNHSMQEFHVRGGALVFAWDAIFNRWCEPSTMLLSFLNLWTVNLWTELYFYHVMNRKKPPDVTTFKSVTWTVWNFMKVFVWRLVHTRKIQFISLEIIRPVSSLISGSMR